MESRIRRFFLKAVTVTELLVSSVYAPAILAEQAEQVVRPEIERREIHEDDIDTEDFEIGAFAGLMNVEDFGTNLVYGARLAYHVTEYVFVEAAYGRTKTEETSAERFGGFQILEDGIVTSTTTIFPLASTSCLVNPLSAVNGPLPLISTSSAVSAAPASPVRTNSPGMWASATRYWPTTGSHCGSTPGIMYLMSTCLASHRPTITLSLPEACRSFSKL